MLAEFFAGLGATKVERFELPNVLAFNFVLYDGACWRRQPVAAQRYAGEAAGECYFGNDAAVAAEKI